MRRLLLAVAVVLLVLGGGTVYLSVVDIPAPTKQVEMVLPDDRLPR